MNHTASEWKKSACILCSINCGLEIQTGGKDGRELLKIRGDDDHPHSKGYLCNKASRLNYYQMGEDRLQSPMRRKADGTYEAVTWETAIKEVAEGLQRIKSSHGGDKILFIGGGGQGNHLGGVYSDGILKTLGVKYRTNALAQEKTGEFWVSGKMFGGGPHGDFEHAEVAVFLGKNPWQSHGFHRARKVMRDMQKDPNRTMIVIDPCKTDSAKMADIHLAVRPGTDAWCLSALIAIILQENLQDQAFIEAHTAGFDAIRPHFTSLSIAEYAEKCGIEESLLRTAARRIAQAGSVSVFEDLGIQQNVNSTVVSYLNRLLWVLTGNFAIQGGHNISVPFMSVTDGSKGKATGSKQAVKLEKKSPVLGSRIIVGLIPCATVPDEILTDHPDRFRAAIIESANPVHSYTNAPRMREAIRALEFSVVIDVAMTETAREASYVLPASSSFEKYECVFFHNEFPNNMFHLRQPIVAPLPGTLAEPEIHTRLLEALGALNPKHVWVLKNAAGISRKLCAATFMGLLAANPSLMKVAPALLYRTLGTTLDGGKAAAAAVFWAICHNYVRGNRPYAARAGFDGHTFFAAERMFDAILSSPSGLITASSDTYEDSWKRMKRADKRIQLYLEELFPDLVNLDTRILNEDPEFPLLLTAGQRRAETQNTIIRNPGWDTKNKLASLYMHPTDGDKLALKDGEAIRVSTRNGSAETTVAFTDSQPEGLVSLPNGTGIDYTDAAGDQHRVGISPNELTRSEERDPFAGTPWYKVVRARVERVG